MLGMFYIPCKCWKTKSLSVCVFVCGMNSSLYLEGPSYFLLEGPLLLFHSVRNTVGCPGLWLAPASYRATFTLACPCSLWPCSCLLSGALTDSSEGSICCTWFWIPSLPLFPESTPLVTLALASFWLTFCTFVFNHKNSVKLLNSLSLHLQQRPVLDSHQRAQPCS